MTLCTCGTRGPYDIEQKPPDICQCPAHKGWPVTTYFVHCIWCHSWADAKPTRREAIEAWNALMAEPT